MFMKKNILEMYDKLLSQQSLVPKEREKLLLDRADIVLLDENEPKEIWDAIVDNLQRTLAVMVLRRHELLTREGGPFAR
jgi:hypothetical protein